MDKEVIAAVVAVAALCGASSHGALCAEQGSNEPVPMTKRATLEIDGRYLITLHELPKPATVNPGGRVVDETWTEYRINATNLKTGETRCPWSMYYPYDFLAGVGKEVRPREFTLSMKDDRTIALAFFVASSLRFHEIDLMKAVHDPEPVVQPSGPRTAYVAPFALLRYTRAEYFVNHQKLLEEAFGEQTRALVGGIEPRIKELIWSDGRWNLTLSFGSKDFVFTRDEGEWQLDSYQEKK